MHGSETNERIKEIKQRSKLKVIKTIQVKDEADIGLYKKYSDADYILHDTPSMEGSIEFPADLIHKLPKGENCCTCRINFGKHYRQYCKIRR